jgi:non-ribosomal peptide synthase protein (TIGR01720 family)
VQQLLAHHDSLRLRFEQTESGWQQIHADLDEAVPFTLFDFSNLTATEQESAIAAKAAELQVSLNLSQGPLAQFALFDLGPERAGKLLIIIHYLVIDSVSWWILLSDLDTAYQQLARGEAIQLPPKTSSFKQWAERLMEYAQADALKQELAYWLAETRQQAWPLPVDFPEGTNTEVSASTVTVSLDVEETQALLHEVPQTYHAVVNDVLLTALAQSFARWTQKHALLVDMEDHGREAIFEDLDISHTVGSFRSVYPVLLDVGETAEPGEALKSVKEQLRRVPQGGIGYGLLRYLSGDADVAEKLRGLPRAEVKFSYLGQFDQVLPESSPFAPDQGAIGPVHSPRGNRSHALEVNGSVYQGRLQLDWTYSENVHQRATVERLAQDFVQALRSLITHCQNPEAGGYTPSDFPLAKIGQTQLDRIAAKFTRAQKVD